MGVWDQFKKAKAAGARLLDRIDEVEREARENDPHKEARRLAFQASETELTGGVEDLEDFAFFKVYISVKLFVKVTILFSIITS